eukprot:gene9039-biopygen1249
MKPLVHCPQCLTAANDTFPRLRAKGHLWCQLLNADAFANEKGQKANCLWQQKNKCGGTDPKTAGGGTAQVAELSMEAKLSVAAQSAARSGVITAKLLAR